jgi:hypothetical protein
MTYEIDPKYGLPLTFEQEDDYVKPVYNGPPGEQEKEKLLSALRVLEEGSRCSGEVLCYGFPFHGLDTMTLQQLREMAARHNVIVE